MTGHPGPASDRCTGQSPVPETCPELSPENLPDGPEAARALQEILVAVCPEYGSQLRPGPGTSVEPASALSISDPDWLRARIDGAAKLWRTTDTRLAGTLWWYSASSNLVAPSLATLVVTGRAVSPDPAHTTLFVRPDGLLSGARSTAVVDTLDLGPTLAVYIEALCSLTSVRPQAAWALAVDAVAGALLRAGTASGRIREATALAEPLINRAATSTGLKLPLTRYTDVGGGPFTHRFVQRVSCCLLYRVQGPQALCTSCPGRPPEDRHQALSRFAQQQGPRGALPPSL